MSPTLLEGVAVIVAIIVAWQIGVRITPDVLALLQRAIDQLYGNRVDSNEVQKPKQELIIDSSAEKEQTYDPENHQH